MDKSKNSECNPNWCPVRAVRAVQDKHISPQLNHEDMVKIGRLVTNPGE